MVKANPRLEAARLAYREALEAARASPSAEAWARLLAAGKELSKATEPPPRNRRGRKPAGAAGEGTVDVPNLEGVE
jgi:hypothetical protein